MGWRVEPRKRGEAVAVTVKGLPELPEGVRAAACTQAVYERGLHRVPVAAPVDSCHLRTLLRGLPDSLKMFVPSLRERIQAATDRNQQNPQTPPPPPVLVLTWAETLHNIVWADPEGGAGGSGRDRRACHKPRPGPPSPPGSRTLLRPTYDSDLRPC